MTLLRDTFQIGTPSNSFRHYAGHTVRRALARLAAVFDRRAHAEAAIIDRYAGHSWTDSTERQLVGDIMKSEFGSARNNAAGL